MIDYSRLVQEAEEELYYAKSRKTLALCDKVQAFTKVRRMERDQEVTLQEVEEAYSLRDSANALYDEAVISVATAEEALLILRNSIP